MVPSRVSRPDCRFSEAAILSLARTLDDRIDYGQLILLRPLAYPPSQRF